MARKTDDEIITLDARLQTLIADAISIERELFALEREDLNAIRYKGGNREGLDALRAAVSGIWLWIGS